MKLGKNEDGRGVHALGDEQDQNIIARARRKGLHIHNEAKGYQMGVSPLDNGNSMTPRRRKKSTLKGFHS